MKHVSKDNKVPANTQRLRQALLVLTGVGAATMAYPVSVQAQTAAPASVTVTSVAAPKNTQIPTPPSWQRVKIKLTKEQTDELAKLGVKTSELDITTYNISQLSGNMVN